MSRQLPSLTSLRAFEAAGRHLSFTRAAEELGVTQAAVSQQIKGLESHLDAHLFRRIARGLELTNAGATLLAAVTKALDDVQNAVVDIAADQSMTPLSIRLPPTFAAKWMLPRLESFRQEYPDIDLLINHSNDPVDFGKESVDIAVTYGNGSWPDVVAYPILALDFFPVCAPSCIRDDKPLNSAQALKHYTLLHDASYDNWERWLSLAGVEKLNARRGTILDDTNVLIQAALNGQGVAMCSSTFVADHLESGRLMRPFKLTLEMTDAYYCVCPEQHLGETPIRAFQQWIRGQSQPIDLPSR